MYNMKLHGEIIPDEESMKKLKEEIRKEVIEEIKEEIRKEVIEEIKEDGYTLAEIEDRLNQLSICRYFDIFKATACELINKFEGDFKNHGMFKDDYNRYLQLLAIKNIMNICY